MVKFWCQSGSLSGYSDSFPDSSSGTDSPDGGTDIATMVRRALAEVCTVPVLLVTLCSEKTLLFCSISQTLLN